MLDDYQEVLGAAAIATGSDLNTKDQAEVDKAKQWALDLKPKLRGYSTDDIQNMVGGNAWIHHGWNGDVVNIRNQVKKPDNYSFQKCKEGIPLGTDCIAIPANAEHPGTALPSSTSSSSRRTPPATSSTWATRCRTRARTRRSPSSSRTTRRSTSRSRTSKNGDQFRDLGAGGRRMWDEAWTEIKAA